jgi:hypothetical protein
MRSRRSSKGLDVRRRVTAITLQETIAFNAPYHFPGAAICDGGNAEANVFENLHVNAAQPKADERAEERILGDADDELDAANHGLYQHAVHRLRFAVLRKSILDLGEYLADGRLVLNA